MLRRVYLPAVMPELITGAQLAFGNAWRALISAEMLIGFGQGLGRSLAYAGETADMIGVMANILTIAILATLIDQVILETLRSEEHTSELQSLMRSSYAVLCM